MAAGDDAFAALGEEVLFKNKHKGVSLEKHSTNMSLSVLGGRENVAFTKGAWILLLYKVGIMKGRF